MINKKIRGLNDTFELSGIWYISDSSNSKISGKLLYDKGEIHLETIGEIGRPEISFFQAIQGANEHQDIPIILGLTTTGEKITLTNCAKTRLQPTMNGLTTATYQATSMFIGESFTDLNQILFDSIYVTYSNLKKWYLRSGISFDMSGVIEKKFAINYNNIDKVSAKIDDNFDLEIYLTMEFENSFSENLVRIEDTPIFLIKCKEKKQIDEFLKIQRCYRYFLMLAMMKNVHPLTITGTINDKKIEIFPNIMLYDSFPETSPDKMLFTFPTISNIFPDVISKWWKLWYDFDDVLTKYFSTLLNSELISIELQFQSLALVLESYHRKKFPEEKDEGYEQMINDMIEKLKEVKDHVKFVKRFKKMGSGPNLQNRLLKLVEISPESFNNPENEKIKFSEDVLNTRNYYAHGLDYLKDQAITNSSELFFLTQQMKILFEGVLLRELPFSNEQIQKIMEKNRKTRNYAKEHS